jgi:predicted TIM-barrel fold metal-dependent hydrolase
MNTVKTTENWTIYNCHIHTFTRQHAPRQFIKWALSDAELGKISGRRVPWYMLFAVGYFAFLRRLAKTSIALSKRSDIFSLLGYSFLLFLQAVLVLPTVLLIVILVALGTILLLQGIIELLPRLRTFSQSRRATRQLTQLKHKVNEGQERMVRSNLLFNLMVWINPASNDIFERTARFFKISEQPTQKKVFKEVEQQYPRGTVFVVLPMDMGFMNMGPMGASIASQHAELLKLAQEFPEQIIPFYAADPRHPDIVQRVKDNLARDKFQGIKIYPNLGYRPDHPRLMEIYKLCIAGNFPVVTHCSPGGIWQYGLSRDQRKENSKPENYRAILDMEDYRELKFCLAHFGGSEEWVKHLKGRADQGDEHPWVKTIYDMIASGKYPNLYTDISYTVFTPKVSGLYVDMVDYLKVMLSHPLVKKHVLFGSDYYMVERESVSEKEVSILLRSRLGEELYKQIAYTNPRVYLGIDPPEQ